MMLFFLLKVSAVSCIFFYVDQQISPSLFVNYTTHHLVFYCHLCSCSGYNHNRCSRCSFTTIIISTINSTTTAVLATVITTTNVNAMNTTATMAATTSIASAIILQAASLFPASPREESDVVTCQQGKRGKEEGRGAKRGKEEARGAKPGRRNSLLPCGFLLLWQI